MLALPSSLHVVTSKQAFWFVLLLYFVPFTPAAAQTVHGAASGQLISTLVAGEPGRHTDEIGVTAEAESRHFDRDVLRHVYDLEFVPFRFGMRAVDLTSYALFAAVPVGMYAYGTLADHEGVGPAAYRLGASEAVAVVGAIVLKHAYGRSRPYAVMDDVTSRAVGVDRWVVEHDTLSFPSGHAALGFAMATSLSLSYPEWYVIAPAFLWAGAVATSRVWLGVHYPSDVLAGALIGAAAGAAVHLLRKHITPRWIDARNPASMKIRISFAML